MSETATPTHGAGTSRRDFLTLATAGFGAVGVGAAIWPFISSMNPAQDTIAAGAPIDIDVSKLEPGQQITVLWRSMPMFISRRTPEGLKTLQDPRIVDTLRDPNSQERQQPAYAENFHRSAKPEFGVLVGICTHLGCIPRYLPEPSNDFPAPGWLGGFFCPCHGSKYDLAGRVFKGVPAPYNLPVPPYQFVDDHTVRLGANPPGAAFDLSAAEQL